MGILHRRLKMVTVNDVYERLNSFAPFDTQDKAFDNSGFLVGNKADEVKKIAVCLDITNDIVEEAYNLGANLIVSHHPVIFNKLASVTSDTVVANLIRKNISAICAHTNLDVAKGGISDIMVELLDFSSDEVLEVTDAERNIGYGRIVTLDFSSDTKALAEIAKRVFNCTAVRYHDAGKAIKRIAVNSGAGCDSESLNLAIEKKCDAIISGDIKWSVFVEAKNRGISVIDAGHFNTENIVCSMLVSMFSTSFPEIEVFVPYANSDICRYI